jgi:3-deoxy-D-manno-octulosonic acid kinase
LQTTPSIEIGNGGQRIAIPRGALLLDPVRTQSLLESAGDAWFAPEYWLAEGRAEPVPAGRGSAWFLRTGREQWVLRHYRRGGFIASISADRYCYLGEARVRAFNEWRLLAFAAAQGLPVPQPVAARYRRAGLAYTCELVTVRIDAARPLSAVIGEGPLTARAWREIGVIVRRMHELGIDHADLNAHNVLLDRDDAVSLIDFDRGRRRPAGHWADSNLARLHHSLQKITAGGVAGRFSAANWQYLLEGYRSQ